MVDNLAIKVHCRGYIPKRATSSQVEKKKKKLPFPSAPRLSSPSQQLAIALIKIWKVFSQHPPFVHVQYNMYIISNLLANRLFVAETSLPLSFN